LSEKSKRKPSGITPPKKLLSIFFFASTRMAFSPKRVFELSTTNGWLCYESVPPS